MEQLTGLQNFYLNIESGSMPMHASSLTIYDRSSAPGGSVDFHDVQRFLAERAHRSPIFRRRLAALPLGITRPYWIDDAGFDIEFHVRHIALPKPGDWRQLCAQVARLHARPLDRGRPLWECYVIDELDRVPGLPRGSFALFLKAHCAALGETLGAQLFAALHELSPDSRASPQKLKSYFDRAPTFPDLLARAALDAAKRPLALARKLLPLIARSTWRAAGHAGRAASFGAPAEPGFEAHAPRTRFNARVTPHRVVDGVSLELAAVERMRDCVPGASVNDVAITIIGEAMRRHLENNLEAPTGSLVAEAPIAGRSETLVFGTRTFADSAIMSMHTDVDDLAQRLRLVAMETARRRNTPRTGAGRRMLLEALELVPALAIGAAGALTQRARLGSLFSPIANTTVASIRGPDVPLYLCGARLVGYYGFAPVHDLAGLAHIVGYYNGTMSIAVTACRTMLKDPERYALCLRDACADLGHALGVRTEHVAQRQTFEHEVHGAVALSTSRRWRRPRGAGRAAAGKHS